MGFSYSTLKFTPMPMYTNYRDSKTESVLFDFDKCPKATYKADETGKCTFNDAIFQLKCSDTGQIPQAVYKQIYEMQKHNDEFNYSQLRNIIITNKFNAWAVLENDQKTEDRNLDLYVHISD